MSRSADRPTFLAIGHLAGVKRQDAVQYVRGLIRRHCVSPESAGFYLHKVEGGFVYEIQEGGPGRTYLPAVLERLKDAPESPVRIALATRMAEVRLEEGAPKSRLLPEGEQNPGDELKPGPRLTPFERDYGRLLVAAVAVCGASAAALASAVAVNVLAVNAAAERVERHVTAAANLPVMHWPGNVTEEEYVFAVRFENGRWSVDRRRVALPAPPSTHQDARPGGGGVPGRRQEGRTDAR